MDAGSDSLDSRSEEQMELSTKGPARASVDLRLPGMLPKKSFHTYLGETSRTVKR